MWGMRSPRYQRQKLGGYQSPWACKGQSSGGGVLWRNDSETGGHWPPVLLELFAWAPIIHISNIFHPLSLFSSSFLLPFLPPSLPPHLWFNWGNGRTNQELQYSARSTVLEISEHTGECRGETANPARVERTRRCS